MNYVEKYKEKILATSPSKELLSELEVHYLLIDDVISPVVCSNWRINLM